MPSSRLLIVTPAPQGSRKGNRITAQRWARLLRSLGHTVTIAETYRDQKADALVALHARKSAASVQRFRADQPDRPIVVALTGTDLYHDLPQNQAAKSSCESASKLVVLQPLAIRALPRRLHSKTHVIFQSVERPKTVPNPLTTCFEVCVSGHLRGVKDPFRAAMAVRSLPETSLIRVTHIGAALSLSMAARASKEMQRNDRYRWLGDVQHGKALRLLARSKLVVVSSKLEGCPTVLSEAIVHGTPVLATRIDGNLGLLGGDYAGYFGVGDTTGLRELMLRCEQDEAFRERLREQCRSKADMVAPRREIEAWRRLLAEILPVA